jgi:hypothetical protein
MAGVAGKTLGIRETLFITGNTNAEINIGAGGTLGSGAFANTSDFLLSANNLSDLANTTTARSNLGLGSAALLNTNQILRLTFHFHFRLREQTVLLNNLNYMIK